MRSKNSLILDNIKKRPGGVRMKKRGKWLVLAVLVLVLVVLIAIPKRMESVVLSGIQTSYGGLPACLCPAPLDPDCYCIIWLMSNTGKEKQQ